MSPPTSPLETIPRDFRDYATACRECLTVLNPLGQLVPMEVQPAQIKLNQRIQAIREKGKPVRIIVLKARRVMVSTATAAKFFLEVPQRSGQHAVVLAHEADATANLFDMYRRFADNWKPFRGVIDLPEEVKNNEKRLEWENGSKIDCHTAGSTAFGRSFGFRYVHFSEAAYFRDQKAILTAVINCVPDDPDTVIVIESTANGIGDEFHRRCMAAMESGSDWELFFFAWWEHPAYSKPLDDNDRGRFQASLDREEWDILRKYNLTLEQMNWRRWAIENRCGGSVSMFKQEFPACIEEAFLFSGRPRFDHKSIERMPKVDNLLHGGLEEDVYAGTRRIIFLARDHGELTLIRRPQENREYVAGADICEGSDAAGEGSTDPDTDWSVLPIADRDTGEVCASLRVRAHPSEFARLAYVALRYYNWASIVPEANGPGLAFIDELLRLQYPPGLIYHRFESADGDPRTRAPMIGWKTTTVTRPQLLSALDGALRDSSIIVCDPIALSELRTFVIKASGKAEAQTGCHDDYVIALALLVIGIQQMPRRKVTTPKPPSSAVKSYVRKPDTEARSKRLRLL